MRITYYLFKTSVKSFDEVWKDGAPKSGYEKLTLKPSIDYDAEAYLQADKPGTPDWLGLIRPHAVLPKPEPLNRSSSLVLLLKTDGRVFAVTFGHGFTAIARSKLEADFGLKVTLNTVNPKKLRSVQARNIDPTTVSKQLVVNQDSGLSVFDVDFYQDLLWKLEGIPEDKDFGKRVSGADACYLTAETDLPSLDDICSKLLKAYRSTRYSQHFSFIDQIRPIREDGLIATLEGKLLNALIAGDMDGLGFALPDISAYEKIDHYVAHRRRWASDFDDLNANAIISKFNAENAGATDHLDIQIDARDDEGKDVHSFPVRECAVFQTTYKGKVYILTLGRWYAVSANYAAQVDEQLQHLNVIGQRGFLPDLVGRTTEGEYNEDAANGRNLILMDKNLVRPAGATSGIEVCDLFSADREFVHVKKHTRSATLSHLLAQGTVSARLFIDDRGYRESFRAALPRTARSLVDPDRVEAGRFSAVYAISAPRTYSMPDDLPFFTKVNLLFHCRELQRMGIEPKLFHIHET